MMNIKYNYKEECLYIMYLTTIYESLRINHNPCDVGDNPDHEQADGYLQSDCC